MDGGSSRFPCSKLKLDNLFLQWLSKPDSQSLVGYGTPDRLHRGTAYPHRQD